MKVEVSEDMITPPEDAPDLIPGKRCSSLWDFCLPQDTVTLKSLSNRRTC